MEIKFPITPQLGGKLDKNETAITPQVGEQIKIYHLKMRIYAKFGNNKYRVPKIKKLVHDAVHVYQ